jgi:SP family sugar:H+ symporter-like MFS transporter
MDAYQRRFGTCVDGICTLSTTRQSAITGLLSTGATIGAVTSGSIANKVSPHDKCQTTSGSLHIQIGLRKTCIMFILIHLVGAAIEVRPHFWPPGIKTCLSPETTIHAFC